MKSTQQAKTHSTQEKISKIKNDVRKTKNKGDEMVKKMVMTGVSVMLACVVMVVAVWAVSSVNIGITGTVDFTPPIKAQVKFASNTSSFAFGDDEQGRSCFDEANTYYYNKSTVTENDFMQVRNSVASEVSAPAEGQTASLCVFDNAGDYLQTQTTFSINTLNGADFSNDLGVLTLYFEISNFTLAYSVKAEVQCAVTGQTPEISYFDNLGGSYIILAPATEQNGVKTPSKTLVGITFYSSLNQTPNLTINLTNEI